MASYVRLFEAEKSAHAETRRKLIAAQDFVATFREFIRSKKLHQDFLEWTLVHYMGPEQAAKILEEAADLHANINWKDAPASEQNDHV